MRKIALLLALCMLFSLLCACGATEGGKVEDPKPGEGDTTTPTPDENEEQNKEPDPTPEDPDKNEPDDTPEREDDGAFITENAADFDKTFGGWENVNVEELEISYSDLSLVNAQNKYDSSLADDPVRVKDFNSNGLAMVNSSKFMLNFITLRKLQEMTFYMNEALSVNYRYCIQAGYLTNEELNTLNGSYPNEYPEKGGESALNTGNAVVVSVYTGAMNYSFMDSAVSKVANWTKDNAHKYGFVMIGQYGENAQLRYVGVAHATYMYENELDLEGYLAKLKGGEKLQITTEGNLTYTVYYASGATIELPKDMVYSVCADNMGGYIVTVKGICQ